MPTLQDWYNTSKNNQNEDLKEAIELWQGSQSVFRLLQWDVTMQVEYPEIAQAIHTIDSAFAPLPDNSVLWHATFDEKWEYDDKIWMSTSVGRASAIAAIGNRSKSSPKLLKVVVSGLAKGIARSNTEKSKIFSNVPTGLAAQVALGGVVGGILVLSAPLVSTAVGFSSVGPIAGTLAAKCMAGAAMTGGIKAGSTYALVQSAAMTGAIITGKSVAIGSVVGAGLPIANSLKNLFVHGEERHR